MLMDQSFKAGISEAGSKGSLESACNSAYGLKAECCSHPTDTAAVVTATRVKVSSVVMGVGIQGEGYAKYFLEVLWKDLYERRKRECDVDNLNIKL